MCGGLDLVVWWFSLLGGFGYMAPGFLVWICGGCLRKFSICGGSGVGHESAAAFSRSAPRRGAPRRAVCRDGLAPFF